PVAGLPVVPPPGFAGPATVAAAAVPAGGYDPADAETIVTGDGDDDPLDRTVVVSRRPVVPWRLVLDDGTVLAVDAVVVVLGRNPRAALTGEQRLVVPDPSRTLSKTHAVLRLEGDQWTLTDLDSTNGVMVPDASGVDQLVDAGVPTPVRDRFVLGTLGVRLERTGETPGGR
ncbi:MAG TPA: FHA domain-containing protein, partial [Agromyces sp.]